MSNFGLLNMLASLTPASMIVEKLEEVTTTIKEAELLNRDLTEEEKSSIMPHLILATMWLENKGKDISEIISAVNEIESLSDLHGKMHGGNSKDLN